MIIFPYRVEQDEHMVWHIRKLTTNECVGCVGADIFEILRGYFVTGEHDAPRRGPR